MRNGNFTPCIVAASLLAFAACHKPSDQTASTDPAPPVAEATPAPAPEPPPQEVAVAATPVPNYLAPEGVYFLVAKASLETSEGILGYKPGTRMVRGDDGRYRAPDGQFLTLEPNQITNDLRVARQAAGSDAAAQAALALAGQRNAVDVSAAPPSANARTAATATPAPSPSRPTAPPSEGSRVGNSASGLGTTHGHTHKALTQP